MGRKRKPGRRYPSGDRVPDKKPDDRLRTMRQPHRRLVRAEDRADPRAECALGRLCLRRLITQPQYDAGTRFAFLVGQYRAIIEGPRAVAGSGRGFDCAGDKARCDDGCECLNRVSRYTAALEVLGRAGRRAALLVNRLAVHGENVEFYEVPHVRIGLQALAVHFGIMVRGRAA